MASYELLDKAGVTYLVSKVKELFSGVTPQSIGAVPSTSVGAANGVASLDQTGKVPSSQLPSYVDDVEEYDSYSSFPAIGESGKIYVDKSMDKTYRWSGSAYREIKGDLTLGETSSTAFPGNRGKALEESMASLSPVASSGSYNDLSDKPTIPVVEQSLDPSSSNAVSGYAIANAGFIMDSDVSAVSNSEIDAMFS
jgi:hypothetical protein